jgi:hypothetical protein
MDVSVLAATEIVAACVSKIVSGSVCQQDCEWQRVSARLSVAACVSKTVSWFEKYQTLLIAVCDQRGEKNTGHPKFRKDNLQHTGATLYARLYGLHGLLFANINQKKIAQKARHNTLRPAYKISAMYICPVFLQFVSRLDYSDRKSMPRENTFGMTKNTV